MKNSVFVFSIFYLENKICKKKIFFKEMKKSFTTKKNLLEKTLFKFPELIFFENIFLDFVENYCFGFSIFFRKTKILVLYKI